MVDRARASGSDEVEALLQLFEGARVLAGSQVEVAAEKQRRITSPLDCGLSRPQDVGGSELGSVICRVQVGDAEAGGGAGKRHRPALRPPSVNRQFPPLDDHPLTV